MRAGGYAKDAVRRDGRPVTPGHGARAPPDMADPSPHRAGPRLDATDSSPELAAALPNEADAPVYEADALAHEADPRAAVP